MIPKTFSAPSDATWPHLNGYAPSIEDSLRYAVWLMFYADDVNRRTYSYDDDDVTRGVRIVQQNALADPENGNLTLPQQVIAVAMPQTKVKLETGGAAEQTITIAVMHLDPVDTSWLDTDVTLPPLTPEARVARWKKILMRGTRVNDTVAQHTSIIVDPYHTPLNEDDTYDMEQLRILANKPPDVKATTKRTIPRRPVKSLDEFYRLDPVRDFAVAFGLTATYTVFVGNRENMDTGGYDG